MAHSWLQRQKKAQLLDLSVEAGLPQDDELLKDEILANLETHLDQNATSLARNAAFEPYYGKRAQTPSRGPGRPPRESIYVPSDDNAEAKSGMKARGRRATKVKQEPQDEDDHISSPIAAATSSTRAAVATVSSALSPSGQFTNARTPAVTRHRRRSGIPGPPSPADVADVVEYESKAFVQRLRDLYSNLAIDETIEYVRDSLSSVTAVQLSFLLLEAYALHRRVLPWNYAFDLPATPLTQSIPVHVPDLFVLLAGYYWSTTLLWAATSIFVPSFFAYFYNLTTRDVKRGSRVVSTARYTADPLIFNVVKAVASWLVYDQGVRLGGWIDPVVAERVDLAIYGGHTAMIVTSSIGALAALYEAAQKTHAAA